MQSIFSCCGLFICSRAAGMCVYIAFRSLTMTLCGGDEPQLSFAKVVIFPNTP